MPSIIDAFTIKTAAGWDHTFLSNGFIEPDGSFVEREYQAAKTLDHDEQAAILACTQPFGPLGSKRAGRAATLRPDWEEIKFPVMARLVAAKFYDHPDLMWQLHETDDVILIEGNTWHDNIWGDCRCGGPDCRQPGLNWLGQILMTVRACAGR